MPGNVAGIMAHEVAHVQGVPQRFVAFKRLGVQGQRGQRLALAGFNFCIGIRCAAAKHPQGITVQIFQQLAFPGVPHLGAGTAYVGHRQQV